MAAEARKDEGSLTDFYARLLSDPEALASFVDDPWDYVINEQGLYIELLGTEANRRLVVSMDEDQIRWAMVEEGNPPPGGKIAARKLMKSIDP